MHFIEYTSSPKMFQFITHSKMHVIICVSYSESLLKNVTWA